VPKRALFPSHLVTLANSRISSKCCLARSGQQLILSWCYIANLLIEILRDEGFLPYYRNPEITQNQVETSA